MTTAARLVAEFYDGTAEKDWPAWAEEAVSLIEGRIPPEDKRERMAFYEEAMRDPKNHGALALELAYLREKQEHRELGIPPAVAASIAMDSFFRGMGFRPNDSEED